MNKENQLLERFQVEELEKRFEMAWAKVEPMSWRELISEMEAAGATPEELEEMRQVMKEQGESDGQ